MAFHYTLIFHESDKLIISKTDSIVLCWSIWLTITDDIVYVNDKHQ